MISIGGIKSASRRGEAQDGRHFAFVLLTGFSHFSFSSVLEPLRSANMILGKEYFTWSLIGLDADKVRASNGVTCLVDHQLADLDRTTDIIIIAGNDVVNLATDRLENQLRLHFRQGGRVGAVSSGVVVLARAGLLDGRNCAAHWENTPRLREDFPRITVTDSIFELHDRLFTCAGGAAGTHLMLALIEQQLGEGLVADIATRMVIDQIRNGDDNLNVKPHVRYGTWNRKVLDTIALMNDNISEPLPMRSLADVMGVSARCLERQFKSELGVTPNTFYRNIRLSRARQLVRYSAHSLCEVAAFSGFGSSKTMKLNYEAQYGISPREERKKYDVGERQSAGPAAAKILHDVGAPC